MNVEIRCDSRKAACSLLDNEPASGKRGEGVGGGGVWGGGRVLAFTMCCSKVHLSKSNQHCLHERHRHSLSLNCVLLQL